MRSSRAFVLGALLPLLMGGCPGQVQDELVNGIETTVRGVINAGLDELFDQFGGDGSI